MTPKRENHISNQKVGKNTSIRKRMKKKGRPINGMKNKNSDESGETLRGRKMANNKKTEPNHLLTNGQGKDCWIKRGRRKHHINRTTQEKREFFLVSSL